MSANDVLVIWGGVKDIGRNNTVEAIEHVNKFMSNNIKMNIVLLNSPHRHDLRCTSCVNNEVINYNNRLKEAIRPYPNVHLLEIELSRLHFTRHGLHLNFTGKKLVSQKVATVVEHIFKTEKALTFLEKITFLCYITLSEDNTTESALCDFANTGEYNTGYEFDWREY